MRTASSAQVGRLLLAFRRVRWPADRRAALTLGAECGWTVQRSSPRAVRYITGLGTNDDRANALIRPGDAEAGTILDLTVHVSDYAPDDPTSLDHAYEAVVAAVEAELGWPVRVDRGDHPRTAWDLDSGPRVAVQRLSAIVIMKLLSREIADLERDEVRLGIDPGRVPGTGHEDL